MSSVLVVLRFSDSILCAIDAVDASPVSSTSISTPVMAATRKSRSPFSPILCHSAEKKTSLLGAIISCNVQPLVNHADFVKRSFHALCRTLLLGASFVFGRGDVMPLFRCDNGGLEGAAAPSSADRRGTSYK